MQKKGAELFLKTSKSFPVIDVRSPKEFKEGHLPGAVNLPLFSDEERAVVGTLYKKQGKDKAVLKGLEIVGPKMAFFAQEGMRLSVCGKAFLHCWRGGMRSESMAWLFEKVGLECCVLKGGYKAYRAYCVEQMAHINSLVVLKGFTGSGKTEILKELRCRGEQVIDLENIARHRGSSFGGIGQAPQPTTQQFQNDLFHALSELSLNRPVWVEGESKSIGRVYVPDVFWELMQNARVVEIVVPFAVRVSRLLREYAALDALEMEVAILRLQKRLGHERTMKILDFFRAKDYENAASLLLAYYDKTYKYADSNYKQGIQRIHVKDDNAAQNADLLMQRIS